MTLWQKLLELESCGFKTALCTVIETSGSTPRKVGAKMIVVEDHTEMGALFGSIGGGAIEHHIRKIALKLIRKNSAQLVTTSLRNDLAMCCGGEMSVFIEPFLPRKTFVCFGAGHIAQALCPLIVDLGFDVIIVDGRKELLALSSFSKARRQVTDTSIFSLKNLSLSADSYVLVATHDHQLDQEILEGVLKYPTKYLALVGSERKKLFTHKRLFAKNFPKSEIEKIICPAGLYINAQTPQEIAVSIAAQMIQVRNHETVHSHCRRGSELADGLS